MYVGAPESGIGDFAAVVLQENERLKGIVGIVVGRWVIERFLFCRDAMKQKAVDTRRTATVSE
jgi:hypothetical protein